jgi:hypothetical protein
MAQMEGVDLLTISFAGGGQMQRVVHAFTGAACLGTATHNTAVRGAL